MLNTGTKPGYHDWCQHIADMPPRKRRLGTCHTCSRSPSHWEKKKGKVVAANRAEKGKEICRTLSIWGLNCPFLFTLPLLISRLLLVSENIASGVTDHKMSSTCACPGSVSTGKGTSKLPEQCWLKGTALRTDLFGFGLGSSMNPYVSLTSRCQQTLTRGIHLKEGQYW